MFSTWAVLNSNYSCYAVKNSWQLKLTVTYILNDSLTYAIEARQTHVIVQHPIQAVLGVGIVMERSIRTMMKAGPANNLKAWTRDVISENEHQIYQVLLKFLFIDVSTSPKNEFRDMKMN